MDKRTPAVGMGTLSRTKTSIIRGTESGLFLKRGANYITGETDKFVSFVRRTMEGINVISCPITMLLLSGRMNHRK